MFPVLYQGAAKRERYFEGWYFKQATGRPGRVSEPVRAISFIPGISRSPAGSAAGDKAFVQVIDGSSGLTRFFPFPPEAFSATDDPFEVRVGENRFSLTGLDVALADGMGRIEGSLAFGPTTPPETSLAWPGVMGPYSYAPFMECYHAVASLDHSVDGRVRTSGAGQRGGDDLSFDSGRGYIEKDWGRSMPRSWVWIQSNGFDGVAGPASFFFSLARVPWRKSFFNGFISILYAAGRQYRFASYTGARVELLEVDGAALRGLVFDRNWKLEFLARRNREGFLAAPVDGAMDRRIAESADAWIRVILKRRSGRDDATVFDSTSNATGVEVVGDPAELWP
jgi:hypothetical protein